MLCCKVEYSTLLFGDESQEQTQTKENATEKTHITENRSIVHFLELIQDIPKEVFNKLLNVWQTAWTNETIQASSLIYCFCLKSSADCCFLASSKSSHTLLPTTFFQN